MSKFAILLLVAGVTNAQYQFLPLPFQNRPPQIPLPALGSFLTPAEILNAFANRPSGGNQGTAPGLSAYLSSLFGGRPRPSTTAAPPVAVDVPEVPESGNQVPVEQRIVNAFQNLPFVPGQINPNEIQVGSPVIPRYVMENPNLPENTTLVSFSPLLSVLMQG